MKLSADHIFHIGSQHMRSGLPCQDYALSGSIGEMVYVSVSDGCSNGDRTDIGARVLSLATAQAVSDYYIAHNKIDDITEFVKLKQKLVLQSANALLGTTNRDMLATNLFSVVSQNGALINVQGDGCIALVYKDGSKMLRRIEWVNNMPLYPVYCSDSFQGFIKAQGGDLAANAVTHTVRTYGQNENLMREENSQVSLESGLNGYELSFGKEVLEDIKYIALFTDGVTQVEGVPWYEAIIQLLAFKSLSGDFAKRRMNRFLKTEKPVDDIAYAVIHVDGETSE